MAATKLLTVEEILQMPEENYMDERQLAFFRNRLEQMEAELRANADQTTNNLRETTIVPDPADRATIEEEHALELRTRDRERKLLKKCVQLSSVLKTATMVTAKKREILLVSLVSWPAQRRLCRLNRNSVASSSRKCTGINS